MISVIIPVYNVGAYIDECLNSIVKQTYHDLEIILVDDGSKDDSGVKCDEWAKKDKRIRVIHKQNEGVSKARNVGLKEAKGEYIAFVDPDDVVHKKLYELFMYNMEKYNVDMVYCEEKAFEENEVVDFTEKIDQIQVKKMEKSKLLHEFTKDFTGQITWVWNKLYKRELLDNISFDIQIFAAEDTIFNAQVVAKLQGAVKITNQLYYYRQLSSHIINLWSGERYVQQGLALEREFEILKECGDASFQEKHLTSCLNKIATLETYTYKNGMIEASQQLKEKYMVLYRKNGKIIHNSKEKMKAALFIHFLSVYHLMKKAV